MTFWLILFSADAALSGVNAGFAVDGHHPVNAVNAGLAVFLGLKAVLDAIMYAKQSQS